MSIIFWITFYTICAHTKSTADKKNFQDGLAFFRKKFRDSLNSIGISNSTYGYKSGYYIKQITL